MECLKCVCLAGGGVAGERVSKWMRGLGLDFTNPVGQGECETCVCVWVAAVWVVSRRLGGGLSQGLGRCGGAAGRSRYLYIVLGRYLRILGTPSVQSCCTLFISASYRIFVCDR